MSAHLVASANVLSALPLARAREVLHDVLGLAPDLVGLQEWYPVRLRLLRETGEVRLVPFDALRFGRVGPAAAPDYVWCAPLLGGCAVGARADRFALLGCRSRALSPIGRADRPERWSGVEPPRVATVARFRDLCTSRTVSLVDYHLAPGVQSRGSYRPDRPLLVARHRGEVRNLQRLVDDELALGHEVHAVGDSNLDGLRLSGLISAWAGRESDPGTLGPRRKVDDVHGPGPATTVRLLTTASDHKAVLATR